MPAPIIPQLRAPITIDASNNSALVDAAAVTIASGSYADLQAVAAAMKAAWETAWPLKTWTFTYSTAGTTRGKWLISCSAVFTLDDNGDDQLALFGFTTSLPLAASDAYLADVVCDYVYTPEYPNKETDPFLPGGFQGDEYSLDGYQTLSMTGVVQTTILGAASWIRTCTFTLLQRADILWLQRFWAIAQAGSKLKFLQDKTVTTGYNEITNPFGFHYVVMDIESGKKFARTKVGNSDYFDVTFILRQWVSP